MELLGRYSKLPALPKINRVPTRPRSEVRPPRVHKAHRRLSSETIANLVSDYESGQPTTALMVEYDLGKGTVLRLLRAAGAKIRAQGQKNIDLAEAADRYQAGWSLARLAERYDCNAETVRTTLKSAGVKFRHLWERAPEWISRPSRIRAALDSQRLLFRRSP